MSLISSRRPALVAGLVTVSLAGVAAVPAAASNYPANVQKAFMSSCEKAAIKAGNVSKADAKTYCGTALKCLEGKLTVKQFVQADDGNSKYKKVVNACVKKGKQAIS